MYAAMATVHSPIVEIVASVRLSRALARCGYGITEIAHVFTGNWLCYRQRLRIERKEAERTKQAELSEKRLIDWEGFVDVIMPTY